MADTAEPKSRGRAKKVAKTVRRTVVIVTPERPLGGFMDFIRTQGVIGLAVGLVLGVQIKAVVDSLIASFINPLLGLILPGNGDLSKKTFALTIGEKQGIFTYGAFIVVLLSFIVVAAVVYFAVKALKLDKLDKKKA